MLRSYLRRYTVGVRVAMALFAAAVLASPLVAQTTATLTEWDVFQATGAKNVLSIQVDTTGATGVPGSVWVTTHNDPPRLGRLDPAAHLYTEWRPIGSAPETSGTPSGMAINPVNGDVWFTNTGRPMLLLKHADPALNDYFRKYTLGTTLLPTLADSHSVGVLTSDASVVITVPTGINQIRGIYRVPRGPAGPIAAPTQQTNVVKYWRMDAPEMPRHMAVDVAGFIWFVNRKTASGILTRLDPTMTTASATNQNLVEWVLPTGTNPVGLTIIDKPDGSGAQTVCVASEAMPAVAGVVQCLDVPVLPTPMTSASVIPPVALKVYTAALNGPQQIAVSGAGELFISEQRANAISFVEPEAMTFLSQPVVATGRAIGPLNRSVVIVDQLIAGSTYPVTPVESEPVKTTPAIGFSRFALSQDLGPAQPVGISTVVTDPVGGGRTVYVAEYFRGSAQNLVQGRIARLELLGSGSQRTLDLSVLSLNRTLVTGTAGQVVETVVVSDGGVPVDWSVEYSGACLLTPATVLPPSQIAFTPASGATQTPPSQLDIMATHELAGGGELAVGEYCARATVSDVGPETGAAEPVDMEFRLTVSPPPEIHVSSAALTFTAGASAPHPATQAVLVSNAGGGSLEWTATLGAEIQGSISIVEQQPGGFEVAVNTPLPPPGIDLGRIVICSNAPNAPSDPVLCPQPGRSYATTIAVEVVVSELQAVPGSLVFATPQNSSPVAQVVTVTAERALSFNATVTTQGGGAWLSVTPTSETTAVGPVTLTVSIASANLPVGQYTGRIILMPADEAPQVVPVTLNVLDSIAPQLVLPADITMPATGTTTTVTFTATATDAVDGSVNVTCTPQSGSQFALGTTTVACTAADAAGNTASGTFGVTVEDGTAPTLHLPGDIAVPATGITTTVTYAATATDLVNGNVAVTCTPASSTAFALGSTTVVCEATDAAGNTANGSFQVTVSDRTAPTIVGTPSPMTVEATGATGALVTFTLPTATDLVDAAIPVSCSPAPAATFPLGQNIVTCSATDTSGNVATSSFTVTVRDTTAPTIAGPADILVASVGPSGAVVNYALPLASDIVDGVVLAVCAPAPGTLFAVGPHSVACTARDAAGNAASDTFTITVGDSTPPVLVVPADATVEASGPGGAPYVFTVTATDATDVEPSVACTSASGQTFALGATVVNCTATDASGNSSADSFVVTVLDTTAPALANMPAALVIEATGPAGGTLVYALPMATDLVDASPAVSCSAASGTVAPFGTMLVTCTAADASGNGSVATFTATVVDTTAPAIIGMPAGITAEATGPAGTAVSFTLPTARDLVDGTVPVFCTPGTGSVFVLGAQMVTCAATDAAGTVATDTFTITVGDSKPPVLVVPADVTTEASGPGGAPYVFTATAADAIDDEPSVVCTPASGQTFALGATEVSCTATDESGNSSSDLFLVTVVDTTAPALANVPAGLTIEATGPGGGTLAYALPMATDLVDASPAVSCSASSGTVAPLGNTLVTCTATDASGNSSLATFSATVVDTTAPSISGTPAPFTAEATGPAGAVVSFTPPTGSDLVDGIVKVSCTPGTGSAFALGAQTVTCTATDAASNVASTDFAITVGDSVAPVLSQPENVVMEATGPAGASATFRLPAATDLVDLAPAVTCGPASGSTFPLGATPVSCIASDDASNVSAPGTFTVTVQDRTAPILASMPNITVVATSSIGTVSATSSSAVVTFALPTATDAVTASPVVSCLPASGSTFVVGPTTVTCSATDAAGNASQGTFVVTVTPRVVVPAPPAVKFPDVTGSNVQAVPLMMAGVPGAAVSYRIVGGATAMTGIGTVGANGLFATAVNLSTLPDGPILVSATQTSSGQTSVEGTGSSVKDTTPPTLTVPQNITVDATGVNTAVVTKTAGAAAGAKGAVVTYAVSAADALSEPVAVQCTPASGATFPVGTTTVSCTATDARLNASARTFTVTVAPVAPPTTVEGRMSGVGHFRAAENTVYFQFHIREKKGRVDEWGWMHLDVKEGGDRDGFATTKLTSVVFSNDPAFQPGRSPRPATDTVVVKGEGRWNGRPGYTFEMRATDQGEPRKDTFQVTIKNSAGRVVASFGPATLAGGNIQSHRLQYWWSGHAWQKGDDADDPDNHQGGYDFRHGKAHDGDDRSNDRGNDKRWGRRDDDNNGRGRERR